MYDKERAQVIEKIGEAGIRLEPFPHVFVEDVFPEDFYAVILDHLPQEDMYWRLRDSNRVTDAYSPHRLALSPDNLGHLSNENRAFWIEMFRAFLTPEFTAAVFDKFRTHMKFLAGQLQEAGGAELNVAAESFLIRDKAGYELGPHTDSPAKLVSMLFYLAPNEEHPELGTTFYTPKDRAFFCEGGPHHSYEQFERADTIPYKPNCLLAFPKTEHSFHGVEPVSDDTLQRDLLFFDLRRV